MTTYKTKYGRVANPAGAAATLLAATLLCALYSSPLVVRSRAQTTPGIKYDRGVYPEPPLPPLPPAGGKFNDPTFGTEILRATGPDDCTGAGCSTYYSHWPTFNSNNTRILVRNDNNGNGDGLFKTFDAVNFAVGVAVVRPALVYVPGEGATAMNFQSAYWHPADPDVVYCFPGSYGPPVPMGLYTYNVALQRYSGPDADHPAPVKDFSSYRAVVNGVTQPDYLAQMSMSSDGNVFAFNVRRQGRGDLPIAYLVWNKATDQVTYAPIPNQDVNEVRIDKSGTYLSISHEQPPCGNDTPPCNYLRAEILNLSTGVIQQLHWNGNDNPFGHGDIGTRKTAGFAPWGGGIRRRRLDDLYASLGIAFDWKTVQDCDPNTQAGCYVDWSKDFHGSLIADNEDWMTIGTYLDWDNVAGGTPDRGLLNNEIVQVSLDGSQRIRRLAHTRSVIAADGQAGITLSGITPKASNNYWATPKPTISKDGRFIAFTSNWGNSDRYDVFIVKIPPAPVLTGTGLNVKVNFQPDTAAIPAGYLPDSGLPFADRGNGYSYGWDASNTGCARDRNMPNSPDQRYDTLVGMQYTYNATWEIAVPNGTYNVRVVAGDAEYYDNHVYKINVEGVLTVDGVATSTERWKEGTTTVTVTDGKLTVSNAAGSLNNSLCFIEISSAPPPQYSAKINFQPDTAQIPTGYLPDSGLPFANRGNGYSYGWDASNTGCTRDRNMANSPDQRYDTLVGMQYTYNATWEIAVPNGTYTVHLVAGDAEYYDNHVYKINVEGVLTVDGVATSTERWKEGTTTVTVTDGKLTVSNAAGSANNSLCFIEITSN